MYGVTSKQISKQNISFHPYRNATIGIVALAALAALLFASKHKYDFAKSQETLLKFFSEELPLRITLVSAVAILTIVLPYSFAYRVDYKMARLKEASLAQGMPIPDKYKDLMGKIAKHNASIFVGDEKELRDALAVLPEGEQEELWKLVGQKVLEDPYADGVKVLAKLAQVFPVQAAKGDEEADPFCLNTLEEAKLYLHSVRLKPPVPMNARLSSCCMALASVIENILNGLGIADFLGPKGNETQAMFKAQKLMMLINIFTIVTQMLMASMGYQAGGTLAATVFGGLSVASIVWPSIRPLPLELPGDPEAWTQLIQEGRLSPLAVREASIEAIDETLQSKRHVLLLGESRGGKTQTAKAYAAALEEDLKRSGKKVFRWNGGDLAGHQTSAFGSGEGIIHDIRKAIEHNEDNIVIIIDEIHALFREGSPLGAQLLSLIDEGGPFRQVIGITTCKEFKEVIVPKDPASAFSNRFVPMPIDSMKPHETQAVLTHNLRQNGTLAADGILAQMSKYKENDPNFVQPYTSVNILKKAMELVKVDPFKKLDGDKPSKTVQASIRSTTEKLCHRKKVVPNQQEIDDAKAAAAELARKKKVYGELQQLKAMILQVTKAKYAATVKGCALPANSNKRKELALQVETLETVETALKADLIARSNQEGFKLVIDQEILDKAIAAIEEEAVKRAQSKGQNVAQQVARPLEEY